MFVSGACAVASAPENLSEAFCQYSYLTVICICKLCIWHLLFSVALELVGSQNGCTMKLLVSTSLWELLKGRNSTFRASGKDKKKKKLVITTPASYSLLPKNDLKNQSVLLKELSVCPPVF